MPGVLRPVLLALLIPTLFTAQEAADAPWGWGLRAGERNVGALANAAFDLGTGATLDPLANPRTALELSTDLQVPSRGRYRFEVEVTGGEASLALKELGPVSSAWVELPAGPLRASVRVERRGIGPLALRVFWERAYDADGGFLLEPIPSRATRVPSGFTHDAFEARVLVEAKGCTNCHAAGRAKRVLRERVAPPLDDVGERASAAWLERWLRDPSRVRPGADMPDFFHAGDEEDLGSLVHYLTSLRSGKLTVQEGSVPVYDDAFRARGRDLYHSIGCIACHGALASPSVVLDDDYLPRNIPSVDVPAPFGDLRDKWNPVALAAYLRQPHTLFPDGRMPDLSLEKDEAVALAAYLASEFGGAYAWTEPDPDRVAHGKEIVSKNACLSCHSLANERLAGDATPLEQLEFDGRNGCLAKNDPETPTYALSGEERELLRGLLSVVDYIPDVPAPVDELQRTLTALACQTCHAMDGNGGVAEELDLYFQPTDERVDLGDEGRLPPELSDAGWRLTTHWLREVLLNDGRSRPYLAVRMPRYRSEVVRALPGLFARAHGVEPDSDVEEPLATDELILAGRDMMGRTAFGCLACHVYGDYSPTGSPGPAIDRFGERLRYEWTRLFLPNPQHFRPGSRMPDFAAGGKSMFKSFFDGDLEMQVDALWVYFSLGEGMPPPGELVSPDRLRLVVDERPLVHRGFLESAGTRGIAVGLPNGVHYAFDADGVRLVDVWRGAFLNASGSWAGRGGSLLGGRGEVVWETPPGTTLRVGPRALQAKWGDEVGRDAGLRFGGYRLDADGHPTFLYSVDGIPVEESVSVAAAPEVRITRRFRIRAGQGGTDVVLRSRVPNSMVRWREPDGEWRGASGRTAGGFSHFSLTIPTESTLEVELEVVP